MLPPYIIEQLRQREEARKQADAQIQLELPVPPHAPQKRLPVESEEKRGVVIIDLG